MKREYLLEKICPNSPSLEITKRLCFGLFVCVCMCVCCVICVRTLAWMCVRLSVRYILALPSRQRTNLNVKIVYLPRKQKSFGMLCHFKKSLDNKEILVSNNF